MPAILLDYGSGGKASRRLVHELFLRYFHNPILDVMDDAALLDMSGPLAMSTDGYTVTPLFFPGGSIGTLAIHGTVNDVSMLGAKPLYLSVSFILEEGLDYSLLEKVVADMGESCKRAGVCVVTGDTKVVPRGACDKMFITTTGIGSILVKPSDLAPAGHRAQPNDAILVSGAIGDHGLTIFGQRENLSFLQGISSDSTALNALVADLLAVFEARGRTGDLHVLRDPTRGGLATTLNEIAGQSGVDCLIEENAIPMHEGVRAGCDILGLDPLYLANEGKCLCFVPEDLAETALDVMRSRQEGKEAARIGTVRASDNHAGRVILQTAIGGKRLLPMLEGDQLPRIC